MTGRLSGSRILSRTRTRILFSVLAAIFSLFLFSECSRRAEQTNAPQPTTIVFKHGKIEGDPAAFRRLIEQFERENPGVLVKDETLPSSTDEQHQYYVINLESKSAEFDVLSADVIWVPEFARAGWLRDLGTVFPDADQSQFFAGPIEAARFEAGVYAVPWYIDAGVLYFRKDLLKKYNRTVPATWEELADTSKVILAREPGMYGYVWQGKQYEGLVCNALEFIWSNGGEILSGQKPVVNSAPNTEALAFMRELIKPLGVTPPLVTTATEEPTRQLFGSGKALFMRNWPYAYTIMNKPGSPVRGNVGLAPLPAFPGHNSASVLGGWLLAVNRFSLHPGPAEKLVLFLTSAQAERTLALQVGYNPTRKKLYDDPVLLRERPLLTRLYPIFLHARPRPVTPYYMMITEVLQPEFSAAITGIKTPQEALASAEKQIAHVLGAKP